MTRTLKDEMLEEVDALLAAVSDPEKDLAAREQEIVEAYDIMEEDAARLEDEMADLDKRAISIHEREVTARQMEQQAKAMMDQAKRELSQGNPYHPSLNATLTVPGQYATTSEFSADGTSIRQMINPEAALQYRIYTPGFQWNDEKRHGCVRLALYNQATGQTEIAAYALSERTLLEYDQRVNNYGYKAMEQIGQKIAEEIFDHMIPTVKKYARQRRTY